MTTVLLIEDMLAMRVMIKKILGKWDIEVIQATNGKVGRDILLERSDEIDCILLDAMMPVMDGEGFLNETKNICDSKKIPICMLTALNDRGNIAKYMQHGALDYVTKPIDPEVLVAKIMSLVNETRDISFPKVESKSPVFFKKGQVALMHEFSEIEFSMITNVELRVGETFEIDLCELFDNKLSYVRVLSCEPKKHFYNVRVSIVGMKEIDRSEIRKYTVSGKSLRDTEEELET